MFVFTVLILIVQWIIIGNACDNNAALLVYFNTMLKISFNILLMYVFDNKF